MRDEFESMKQSVEDPEKLREKMYEIEVDQLAAAKEEPEQDERASLKKRKVINLDEE